MALKKTIVEKNGAITDYHRINDISCNKSSNENFYISVTVLGYTNEDYRNQNLYDYVKREKHSFTLNEVPTDIYRIAYEELKKTDLYKDAIDV